MRRIVASIFIGFLLIGPARAEEREISPVEKTPLQRRVHEISLNQAVLQRIRAENRKAPVSDLSQLLKESDEKETPQIDDSHPRDYDADVKKLFDSLY
jgi:hypothetical protein